MPGRPAPRIPEERKAPRARRGGDDYQALTSPLPEKSPMAHQRVRPVGTDVVRSPGVVPVSVVIPAWRCVAFVETAVRSVQAQTLQPVELIVVDDASGDGTAEAARALGATVIEHESNQGVGQARN